MNGKAPAAAAPPGKGRAGRFAPLPVGAAAGLGIHVFEESEDKMESPMTTILELHVSGLREGRSADLLASADRTRYRPVGGLPRPPRLSGPIEHSRPSSRERQTRRIGIELRQTILNSFYEAKGARG